MKQLKIKKEYIGAKVRAGLLNKWYIIEEGNEELYWQLGMLDIFDRSQPAIIKKKIHVKNRKKSEQHIDSDSERTNNDSSPILPL
jgi:hypothetical protein